MRFLSAVLCLAVAALTVVAVPAYACGGFFCGGLPMNQAGETIIFTLADDAVEAHVQIQYAGTARKFAWVVPVEHRPTLGVGSPPFFAYLATATRPAYVLDGARCGGGVLANSGSATGEGTVRSLGESGVTVVAFDQVGPYDAAILRADDGEALNRWLGDNGYDLTPAAAEALVPYVARGYFFVALKLQANRGVGDLRPIVLRFQRHRPCIPIRLTTIAVQPDMPIRAYLFANHRAVPSNYRHVVLNETKIDWLNAGSNYVRLASQAVDEAGGKAFLTEFAGRPSALQAQQGPLYDGQFDVARLAAAESLTAYRAELARQQLPSDSAVQELIDRYAGMEPFDAAALTRELDDLVLHPLRRGQEILDTFPYLTVLFTTQSADEMTVDPEFHLNPDLPPVDLQHRATVTDVWCDSRWSRRVQNAVIDLPDGRYFWTNGVPDEAPSAERVEQIPATGPPIVVQDNRNAIEAALRRHGGGVRERVGCAAVGGEPDAAAVALAALPSLRRRRRVPRV